MFVIYAGQNDGKYIYPYVLQKTLMRRATVYNEPDYVKIKRERTRRASLEGRENTAISSSSFSLDSHYVFVSEKKK